MIKYTHSKHLDSLNDIIKKLGIKKEDIVSFFRTDYGYNLYYWKETN